MTTGAGEGRHETDTATKRVHIAVHGHESGPSVERLIGAVHERVLRHASRAVLVTPQPVTTRGSRSRPTLPWRRAGNVHSGA